LIQAATLGIVGLTSVLLFAFGLNLLYLTWRATRLRPRAERGIAPGDEPLVCIQVPVYNERYVAERVLDAVCEIEWPPGRLEVQVLDDSDDETTSIVARRVAMWRLRGIRIAHVRRGTRKGYKAGALAHGLALTEAPLVAIFDADFVPPRDFLRRTVGAFDDPRIGFAQARWGHLDEGYSWFTRLQALAIDFHFLVEQAVRSADGYFTNFTGTAGIWRRKAIEDSGGWSADTLTEDLDLSYRAQLRGWRFVFVSSVIAPAEVPVEMNGFKSQQHRWAKGSIQTCCKLLPMILRADLPLGVKVEAFFHLTANFNYPLMCVLSVLMFPSMVIRYNMGWYEMLLIDVPLFFAATFSVCNFYMVCQREIHRDWRARLKYLPFLMSIGIGLSINNTRAVLEALFNKHTDFERTPKYRIEGETDEWVGKRYRQSVAVQPFIELALGLYFTATVFYALANQIYGTVPFLVLFQIGFLYTGLVSIVQQYAEDRVVLKTQVASGK
jgi:cellulose synthase/poly-beta-1,6-N-acetylglucosamine synthase-like glycosyltransferase